MKYYEDSLHDYCVLLPVVPTAPLLLLSYLCFSKGSPKVKSWFESKKFYKKHIGKYIKAGG